MPQTPRRRRVGALLSAAVLGAILVGGVPAYGLDAPPPTVGDIDLDATHDPGAAGGHGLGRADVRGARAGLPRPHRAARPQR